jgi:hypothetical protein
MKINEIVAEGLGYSQDPEQGKWYHEGRKAYKGGTTSETGLIQDIARKHGCPPEWLDAFRAGYQDQEGWSKQEMSEGTDHELQADDGEFYKNADDFFGKFEAGWFDNEVESPDGMEVRGYIDDVNVMAWRYKSSKKISGWGNYDDSGLQDVNEGLAETTSSSGVATAMAGGNGSPNVGTLFGGNYKPKTPFTAKKKVGKK